jgi:hypothetical protein
MDQKSRDKLAKPMDWKKAYPDSRDYSPDALGYGQRMQQERGRRAAPEREKENALKKARRVLDEERPQSKGSRGRESAGKQRDRDARVLIRAGAVDKK